MIMLFFSLMGFASYLLISSVSALFSLFFVLVTIKGSDEGKKFHAFLVSGQ